MAHALLIAGFTTLALNSGLVGLGLAVTCIAIGNAVTRPALGAALSLSVDAQKQGAVMGITLWG